MTLFLDIDGTMTSGCSDKVHKQFRTRYPDAPKFLDSKWLIAWRAIQSEFYNETAVSCLNTVIRRCEIASRQVQIIVSSSARVHCQTREELQQLFGTHAFAQYITGKTEPERTQCKAAQCPFTCRGGEIFSWLQAHPEVTRYVALDDESWHFQENGIARVQIYADTGLTMDHFPTLRKILDLPSLELVARRNTCAMPPSRLVVFLDESLRAQTLSLKLLYENGQPLTIVPLTSNHKVRAYQPQAYSNETYENSTRTFWIQKYVQQTLSIEEWMQSHPNIGDILLITPHLRAMQSRWISKV